MMRHRFTFVLLATMAACSTRSQTSEHEDTFRFPSASDNLVKAALTEGHSQQLTPQPDELCDASREATAYCIDSQRVAICHLYEWRMLNCAATLGSAVCDTDANGFYTSCYEPQSRRDVWDYVEEQNGER